MYVLMDFTYPITSRHEPYLIYYLSRYVYTGKFTVGDYVMFGAYVEQLYGPLNMFGAYYR